LCQKKNISLRFSFFDFQVSYCKIPI
jgi:hypothetical protein